MAKILYFGRLTDIVSTSAETISLPEHILTTSELRAFLDTAKNAGGVLLQQSIRIAINNEFVTEPARISNMDEIAFMPPVGGG